MSYSPERISSYRRHFEGASSMAVQIRLSSPSPIRRGAHHRSASYSAAAASGVRAGSRGRRTFSSSRKLTMAGANSGALCVGYGMGAQIDLDAAAAENQEFLSTRSNERKEMVLLNDRLAAYIEKVRSLEQQNMLLETEIEALKGKFLKPSGLRRLYEDQLRELTKIAEQMTVQRNLAVAAKELMAGQLEIVKAKYEEALEQRKQAEMDLEAFRPDVDAATSARIALEKQLEQLEKEIEFLQRVQKQEIEELMRQIYSAHVTVQSAFALPDLSIALKEIQAQYDGIAAKNLQEMDTWYSSKFEDLTNKSTKSVERVRSAREEMTSARKDIQTKERELEAQRTRNEALIAQIRELQERHKKELEELEARIEALKIELQTTKKKMAHLMREYQELLNVKMSLEIEITAYRKLIEGEDSRLTGMVQSLSLMSSSMRAASTSVSVSKAVGAASTNVSVKTAVGTASTSVSGSTAVGTAGGRAQGLDGGLSGGISSGLSASGAGSNGVGSEGVGSNGVQVGSNGVGFKGAPGSGEGSLMVDGNGGGSNGTEGSNSAGGNGTTCSNGITNGGAVVTEYEEQAVEVTERKTMLIRTVRTKDNNLEQDTLEQTVTITGAADDAEFD